MRLISIALASLFVVAAPAAAQRTSVSRDFPVYANGGKPDLTVDPQRVESQMEIVDRYFEPEADACAFAEEAILPVGASGQPAGYRRLLRFDTVVMNAGDGDLVIGDRSDPSNPYADIFYFAECHGHYHMRDFSKYELLQPDGVSVAAAGHKQGFCFTDSLKYDGGKSSGYNCHNQGITSGWGDWYYKQLVGQWIDITGVPAGDYIVQVTINLIDRFDEGENRYPNVVRVPVRVPDPRKKVTIVP